ncbi:hypothetical protein EDC96DRAFT_549888, partial [Choanephora cucurbitarum]
QELEKDHALQAQVEEEGFNLIRKDRIVWQVSIKHRTQDKNITYRCVPQHREQKAIKYYHKSKLVEHTGANKTKKRMLPTRLWFPEMDRKVTNVIRSCQIYQQLKGNRMKQAQLVNTATEAPFKRVAVDFFGPLLKTKQGNISRTVSRTLVNAYAISKHYVSQVYDAAWLPRTSLFGQCKNFHQ